MSTGRFTQRGYAFQSFAFRTWTLAGNTVSVADDWITTRLVLVGTSQYRATLHGVSMARQSLAGTSQENISLTGASK